MVFTAKVCVSCWCDSWEGDFSGYRIPGMQNARRRWCVEDGKRVWAWDAAWEMVDSSVAALVYDAFIEINGRPSGVPIYQ
jgi:hypothetical protein